MLNKIAIFLNISAVSFFFYMTIVDGTVTTDLSAILFLIVLPIINIFALVFALVLNKDNWASYYFKRKKLEEKKKISQLENEIK